VKAVLIYFGAAVFWVFVYQLINIWGMSIQGLSYLEHIDMFSVF
jgi:hypothetical protein